MREWLVGAGNDYEGSTRTCDKNFFNVIASVTMVATIELVTTVIMEDSWGRNVGKVIDVNDRDGNEKVMAKFTLIFDIMTMEIMISVEVTSRRRAVMVKVIVIRLGRVGSESL